MTQDAIEKVVAAALATIGPTSTIGEMETAVAIAKNGADAAKTQQEARYALSQIRLERLKAWPALVVPVVTLITLAATVLIQTLQLNATRQQTEDTQWLDFLKSLRSQGTKTISDVTVAPQLRLFIKSRTYSEPALEMARRLLGSLVDQAGFIDLFNTLFPEGTDFKISDLTDVARNLNRTRADINGRCLVIYNTLKHADPNFSSASCASPSVLEALAKLPPGDSTDKFNQTISDFVAVNTETSMTSIAFGKAMRATFSIGDKASTKPVDLAGVYLFAANFSGVDFHTTSIEGAWFDQVNFQDANLVPSAFRNVTIQGSNWWEAREVDPTLLNILMAYAYPGAPFNQLVVGSAPLTKDYYTYRVKLLCGEAHISCSDQQIFFNPAFTFSPAPTDR